MLFESFEAYNVPQLREESKIEAKREYIIRVLEKIGELSNDVRDGILSEDNIGNLDKYFELALESSSINEFEEKISKIER